MTLNINDPTLKWRKTGLKGRELVRENAWLWRGFRDQECLDLINTKDEPNVQFEMPHYRLHSSNVQVEKVKRQPGNCQGVKISHKRDSSIASSEIMVHNLGKRTRIFLTWLRSSDHEHKIEIGSESLSLVSPRLESSLSCSVVKLWSWLEYWGNSSIMACWTGSGPADVTASGELCGWRHSRPAANVGTLWSRGQVVITRSQAVLGPGTNKIVLAGNQLCLLLGLRDKGSICAELFCNNGSLKPDRYLICWVSN